MNELIGNLRGKLTLNIFKGHVVVPELKIVNIPNIYSQNQLSSRLEAAGIRKRKLVMGNRCTKSEDMRKEIIRPEGQKHNSSPALPGMPTGQRSWGRDLALISPPGLAQLTRGAGRGWRRCSSSEQSYL